jgi:hypothetical protein
VLRVPPESPDMDGAVDLMKLVKIYLLAAADWPVESEQIDLSTGEPDLTPVTCGDNPAFWKRSMNCRTPNPEPPTTHHRGPHHSRR